MTDKADDVQVSADADFEHLAFLVSQLEHMQGIGERLAKSQAATAALDADRQTRLDQELLRQADADLSAARHAYDEAVLAGEQDKAQTLKRDVLFRADARGLREGPAAASRVHADELLAQGGFETLEDAQAAVLDGQEKERLHSEVSAYQCDYAQTLARCQAHGE